MAMYIGLLRGVNVGQNTLRMERLRELWLELDFKNARTYVQSGNVVFEAEGSRSNCCRAIEERLVGETRLPVSVILRTPAEFAGIIARNPFLRQKGVDTSRLHVTFLSADVRKDAVTKLSAVQSGADQFHLSSQEVYLYCPNGYGTSKLSNNAIEKMLSVRATTRNWNTVNKLYEIASK